MKALKKHWEKKSLNIFRNLFFHGNIIKPSVFFSPWITFSDSNRAVFVQLLVLLLSFQKNAYEKNRIYPRKSCIFDARIFSHFFEYFPTTNTIQLHICFNVYNFIFHLVCVCVWQHATSNIFQLNFDKLNCLITTSTSSRRTCAWLFNRQHYRHNDMVMSMTKNMVLWVRSNDVKYVGPLDSANRKRVKWCVNIKFLLKYTTQSGCGFGANVVLLLLLLFLLESKSVG